MADVFPQGFYDEALLRMLQLKSNILGTLTTETNDQPAEMSLLYSNKGVDMKQKNTKSKSEDQKATKEHKRGWHQGTITEMPNGKFRAFAFLENGKRVSKVLPTKTDCNKWISQVQGDPNFASKNIVPAPTTIQPIIENTNIMTIKDWMDGWLAKMKFQVKPNTYRDYALYSRRLIVPGLGNECLTKLTRKQINAFYDELSYDDVTAQTIRHMHRVLHHALEDAYEDEEIISNPAHKTRLPRIEQKEMKFLNEEQVRLLLIAVRGQIREPLYDLAVKLGPRQGELLGLKWEDVDFLHGTLKIRRQVQRETGKGLQLCSLKTPTSYRTLHLGDNSLDLLMRHRVNIEEMKNRARNLWQENDLLFPTEIGTMFDQSNLDAEFKAILELAGLPEIRFHDLRHTAASIMLKHLKDILRVSRTLGHSRPSTTLNVYGHLIPGIEPEAANIIDDLLTPTLLTGFGITEIGIAVETEIDQKMSLTRLRKISNQQSK